MSKVGKGKQYSSEFKRLYHLKCFNTFSLLIGILNSYQAEEVWSDLFTSHFDKFK